MTLFQPAVLIGASTTAADRDDPWRFAAIALLISTMFGVGLLVGLEMVGIFLFMPRGGIALGRVIEILGILIGTLAVCVLLGLFVILIWGLGTQFMLRLTGKGHQPLRQTYRALCYSSGAHVSSIAPCLGWYFGWIWWLVSAVLMVRATHRISAGRAAFSVLTLPVLTFIGAAGAYGFFIYTVFSAAGGPFAFTTTGPAFGTTPGVGETRIVLNAYLGYAKDNGVLPKHPVELLLDDRLSTADFASSESMTNVYQINWPSLRLSKFNGLSENAREKKIKAFVSKLPSKAFAHRAGDYVFTCPGVDPTTLSPDVWLVIYSPMPGSGPVSPWASNVYVGRADGTVRVIPQATFWNSLQGQMAVRKKNNLPPLPNLMSITHARPAVEK